MPNIEHGMTLPTDPHEILNQIQQVDMQIAELRDARRQLLNHYQTVMVNIEKHYQAAMSEPVPEESPIEMPMPDRDSRRW